MALLTQQCIIRASPFSLFHKEYQSDFVVFWPPWNDLNVHVQDVDMNEAGHRERVSYARVLMFFQSRVHLDDNSVEDVSLAYIEEFWEYKRNNNSSLVGSGNLQLYAPQVYYVIPVERILCKADIMRDPVTPRIPAGALPRNRAQREREYPHAKDGGDVGGGSAAAHCTFTTIGACNGAFIRKERRHRGVHFFESNFRILEISIKHIT